MANIPPSDCPVCAQSSVRMGISFVRDYSSHDGEFSLWHCHLCGVQFWMPFLNPGAEWYRRCAQNLRHREAVDAGLFAWNAENRKITKHFFTHLPHPDPRGKTLLDVGCGTGGFLYEAKKKGYEVYGVDFDAEQVAVAQRFGIRDAHNDDIMNFLENNGGYDVVTAFEVLEHLDNPTRFLSLVYGALKQGGVFCMSTPNRKRIGARNEFWDFPFHHLTRWDRASLSGRLETAGFRDISVTEELPQDYLIAHLRTGFGKRARSILRRKRGVESLSRSASQSEYRDAVALVGQFKDNALKVISYPVAVALSLLGKKGQGLYATARK